MHVSGYLPSAVLLLLQTADALPHIAAGRSPSNDLLTRSVASAADAGDQTGVLAGLLADKSTTSPPKTEAELQARLAAIWADSSVNFYVGVKAQIDLNISLLNDLSDVIVAPYSPLGATDSVNPRSPDTTIYPQKSEGDAPYSTPESVLRSALYIPADFTYGQKPPLIFVPGTGTYGGEAYANNLLKLMSSSPLADPVLLNVPDALLDDAQSNAEFVAYAVNYISGISGNSNVSLVSWSQGGLDVQWAFTFWPSIRSLVSDFVAVSPDFHGTVLAPVLCLSPGKIDFLPCSPSVIQQEYDSNFVAALRAKGGDTAYVPTTTLYSGFFDEIVEPQQGLTASAYLKGATNVDAQLACFGRPGGAFFYGHAGMLYSPLTAALLVDALSHDGPADLSRIDLASVCRTYVAPGLTVLDATATAGLIVPAALRILAGQPRLTSEPALRSYAV